MSVKTLSLTSKPQKHRANQIVHEIISMQVATSQPAFDSHSRESVRSGPSVKHGLQDSSNSITGDMLIGMLYSPNYVVHLMKLNTTWDRSEPSVQLFERRAGGVVHSESSCELSLKASFRHKINSKAGAVQDALHLPEMLKNTLIKTESPIKMK